MKYHGSVLLALSGGIHRSPLDFPHKGPIMRKEFQMSWRHHAAIMIRSWSFQVTVTPRVTTASTTRWRPSDGSRTTSGFSAVTRTASQFSANQQAVLPSAISLWVRSRKTCSGAWLRWAEVPPHISPTPKHSPNRRHRWPWRCCVLDWTTGDS